MLIMTPPAGAGETRVLEDASAVREYASMQLEHWNSATAHILDPFTRDKIRDLVSTPWHQLTEEVQAMGVPLPGLQRHVAAKVVDITSTNGLSAIDSFNKGNVDGAMFLLEEPYKDLSGPLVTVIDDAAFRAIQATIPALLSSTLDGWPERSKAAQQYSEEVNQIWSLVRSTQDSVKDSVAEINERLQENAEHIKDAELKRETEWQAVVQAHRQKLELDATSVFWTNRAVAHRARAMTLGKSAFAAGASSLLITLCAAYGLFHTASWLMGTEGAVNPLHRLIFSTAGIALVLTLCLWTTRLVVRLYMTERHLAIDADSRAALGTTYLSLTSEGAATPEDRAIVLAALFRPVQDGIVQDDALPLISPAALMTGLLTQDKK